MVEEHVVYVGKIIFLWYVAFYFENLKEKLSFARSSHSWEDNI